MEKNETVLDKPLSPLKKEGDKKIKPNFKNSKGLELIVKFFSRKIEFKFKIKLESNERIF